MRRKSVTLVIPRLQNPSLYRILRRTSVSIVHDAFAQFAVYKPSRRFVASSDAMKVLLKSMPSQLRRQFRAQILAARKW